MYQMVMENCNSTLIDIHLALSYSFIRILKWYFACNTEIYLIIAYTISFL